MKVIRLIIAWLIKWFWIKPISKPEPLKATDVINQWICVKYHDQWINIRKSEMNAWNLLGRKDRRAMAQRFNILEKKGHIRFMEINGKMTCVKNKDYEGKADALKSANG
jgi:hypothetical protein